MEEASKFAKNKLLAASRAKDKSHQIALACVIASGGILVLLTVAMLDYWFMLSMTLRLAGIVLLAVVLFGGVYQLLKMLRNPTHLKDAALDAEAQRPDLGCELSTAAEYLSGERKITQQYETEVAAALQAKAAHSLKQLDLPYWKRPVRPAILLGTVAIAVLLFGVLASGALTAFKRAAAPWSNAAYTQVEVKPGNIEIPVGRDIEIKSVFSGRVPKQAQFEWQDSGNPKWQFASLTRSDRGEYIYPIKNIRTSLKYRVTGSDAVSSEFKVDPYIPPDVREWRVELALPAYTRQPKMVQNVPEIEVLRGTMASFQITPSVKLSKAHLRFNGMPSVDLQPDENGLWKGSFKINKDADYWIELADEKGHTGGNEIPYHIKALADAVPKVEINDPGQDMRAEATNTIAVKISAADDFGIQEVRLVYHRLGSSEQIVTVKRDGQTNAEFTTEIPLSTLDLKPYELVAYHAEATDNNSLDGPGIGKSDVFFIEITSEEGAASKSQTKGQKANLLVIQKQIIADTTALAAKTAPDKFEDLAKRQKDAEEFGHLYMDGMAASGAPAAASQEMEAAIRDMEHAQALLEKHDRDGSLPLEENALARLYHILQMMPELKDMPTVPQIAQQATNESPVIKVVLDAIKKKKKEEPDNKNLAQALQQAKTLQQDQASLTLGLQGPASGSSSGETKLDRAGKEPKDGLGKTDSEKNGNDPKEAQKVAEKENGLSKQTQALAEKLARMAGKDSRLGHGAGKKMGDAAAKMAAAGEAAGKGDMQAAGTKGAESGASLDSAIALLERILNDRPELADVSKEDFPKQYEAAIADYFKKLSHEE